MSEKMMCPVCRIAMNHHAEKLVEPRSAAEAAVMDERMGGVVVEVHQCPGCGGVGERKGS